MKYKLRLVLLAGSLISLVLPACAPRPESPPREVTTTPEEPPPATTLPTPAAPTTDPFMTSQPTGPCYHLLWPLSDGATWTYRLSGPAQPLELTLSSSSTTGGVMLTFNDQTGTLTCADGALSGLPPGIVGHPDLGNQITGSNPRGAYLPSADQLLPLGTSHVWDIELDAGGLITLPASDTPATITGGRLVIFCATGTYAPITLPVGTAKALQVREDIFFEIQVAYADGTQHDVLISTTAQRYYAEKTGLVKVLYEGGTVSTQDAAWLLEPGPALELLAVNLP